MAFLNLDVGILAYEDQPITSSPQLRDVDWRRRFRGLSIQPAGNQPVTQIPAGGSLTLLDGHRTLAIDGTTAFTLTLDPLDPTQYFLTWTAGTAPAFRADRSLTLSGSTLSLTPQANQSAILSITAGSGTFAGVVAGDNVFIPGISTGDTLGPFNPVNEGLWQVLSVTDSTDIVLVRPAGSLAGQLAQTGVVLTANLQVQAYSAAGVQVGDEVDISAGATAPSPLLATFDVTAVTAQRLAIKSTNPLPLVTITPTATGLIVYDQAYNFIYLEADQACEVQANGDTGSTQRVIPWQSGGSCQCAGQTTAMQGIYMKTGPTWELTVVNRSINPLNIRVITAE